MSDKNEWKQKAYNNTHNNKAKYQMIETNTRPNKGKNNNDNKDTDNSHIRKTSERKRLNFPVHRKWVKLIPYYSLQLDISMQVKRLLSVLLTVLCDNAFCCGFCMRINNCIWLIDGWNSDDYDIIMIITMLIGITMIIIIIINTTIMIVISNNDNSNNKECQTLSHYLK